MGMYGWGLCSKQGQKDEQKRIRNHGEGAETSLILHPGQAFLFIGGRGDCAFDSCPPCNICSEIRALEIRSDAFFNNDCPRSERVVTLETVAKSRKRIFSPTVITEQLAKSGKNSTLILSLKFVHKGANTS